MQQPYPHTMMPIPKADELSRQNFIAALKMYAEDNIYPGDKIVSKKRVLPRYVAAHGHLPKSKRDWRKAMQTEPFVKVWHSLARTMQEMNWDAIGEIVSHDLARLMEASQVKDSKGSLVLDKSLEIPRYNSAVDIHCMPGGYHTELIEDDVYAGACFDRGSYYYSLPIRGSSALQYSDTRKRIQRAIPGYVLIDYIRSEFPDITINNIVDLGCTIGGATLPYAEKFPSSTVFGVDVAAPQLRYAHARAEGLGVVAHFRQENAESLSFPDESFDLVVSHGLFHETSAKATPKILSECYRILKSGGVTMHVDTQFARGLDGYEDYYWDWDTHYNSEPYWGTLHSMDARELLKAAGFAQDKVKEVLPIPQKDGRLTYEPVKENGGKIIGSTIFGAQKQ